MAIGLRTGGVERHRRAQTEHYCPRTVEDDHRLSGATLGGV
jgi:hypothetical protein